MRCACEPPIRAFPGHFERLGAFQRFTKIKKCPRVVAFDRKVASVRFADRIQHLRAGCDTQDRDDTERCHVT